MSPVPRRRLCHEDPPGRVCPCDLAALEEIASSGPVFLRGGGFEAGSGQHRFALGEEQVPQRSLPLVGTAYRLDGVAEVGQQLAVLPAANVLHGVGAEGCRSKVSGDRFADLVDPGGVPADVQEAGDRRGPGLDHAGLKVAGGARDADPVHVGEHAQSGRFVGNPVLQAHDRCLGRGDLGELAESAATVCWLFTAMRTTWLVPQSISRGWPTAAG